MKTISEIDVAELLEIAKNLNRKLGRLEKNYPQGCPDYVWVIHQKQTITDLVALIGDEQTPWWKQMQYIGQLADTIPRIRLQLGANIM